MRKINPTTCTRAAAAAAAKKKKNRICIYPNFFPLHFFSNRCHLGTINFQSTTSSSVTLLLLLLLPMPYFLMFAYCVPSLLVLYFSISFYLSVESQPHHYHHHRRPHRHHQTQTVYFVPIVELRVLVQIYTYLAVVVASLLLFCPEHFIACLLIEWNCLVWWF